MNLSRTWIPRALRAHAILLLIACALAPTLGCAQQSLEDQALQQEGLTRAAAGWAGAVGAGLADVPKYPGASKERIRLAPIFSIHYGSRLFIGPLGIAVVAVRWHGFLAGPVLGYQHGRAESDDPHLFGLGDIPASATAGFFAAYSRGPLQISATARQAISHSTNGLEGLLQVNVRHVFATARTLLAIGPDVEFGNGDFERAWFGISPAQSLASGLSVYTPRAGIDRVGVHAGLTHRVSEHILWRVFARLSDITGDAAQSPVIERRSQFVMGTGLAYHF